MQMKILIPTLAAVFVLVSLVTLHMANADSFPSAPLQPHGNQDAIKTTITDGLRLANETSQRWQEKQEHNQSDQQQPLTANGLNSRNHQFDNHSPSVISGLYR
jgi:hypothetical protein